MMRGRAFRAARQLATNAKHSPNYIAKHFEVIPRAKQNKKRAKALFLKQSNKNLSFFLFSSNLAFVPSDHLRRVVLPGAKNISLRWSDQWKKSLFFYLLHLIFRNLYSSIYFICSLNLYSSIYFI
jgi:hypothetical protein